MEEMVLIKGDLFNIAERIKSVNPLFDLYFNRNTDRYEVYAGNMLVFIVPYMELDDRTIAFAKFQQSIAGY